MKAINWKTSSDFTLLLDILRETDEELAIVTYKHTPLGWFHIQILRQLFPAWNFVFVARDLRIKKLLKQSGFRVFQTLQEMDQTLPEGFQIIQENLSSLDYIRFHIVRFLTRIFSFTRKLQPNTDIFSVKHSSWYMLVIGIIVILLLMVGIVSLTTPHAAIIITPQASIQNAVRNVTFVPEDAMSDTLQIPVRRDIFPFELKKTYNINAYDPSSLQRARGIIKVTNSGIERLNIKPQTRVVVDTLVFRTEKWLDIPGAKDSQPGEATVSVIADPIGSDGVLMGRKWNIPENTTLRFPGLSEKDHETLAVTSVGVFAGGDDTYKKLLTEDEYKRIEKVFREQLINDAREEILANFNKQEEFIPLPIPEAMSTLDVTVTPDVQIGEYADKITITGKWNFMVFLYHVATLRKILLDTAQSHLLEDTESLVEISQTPPDIISVLIKTDDPWSIKATAQIPVQVLYDFSSSAGQKTLQNILAELLNADTERAEKTLLNHPYIKSVDIRLTPFWANKLPNTLDKMYTRVQEIKN
jgi:hypothetical protein